MISVEEQERKYLISNIQKKGLWEKEHIVFQWYLDKNEEGHTKKKIIFDLLKARIIYVEITKEKIEFGKSKKKVNYLDINDFKSEDMIGIPFVLKRRSIQGKLFLDKMISSNGICEYLLEDEDNELKNYHNEEFIVIKDVTSDENYYNQNMGKIFTKQDAEKLDYLLTIF